jgi:hypothetical protein
MKVISLTLCIMFALPIAIGQSTGSVNASHFAGLTELRDEGSGVGGFVDNSNFSSGTVKGEPFGIATYTTTWSNSLDSLSGNGSGGVCERGSGTVVLTTPSGDQLTLSQSGLSCTIQIGPGFEDDGTFLITAATGRFTGYTGAGSVVTGVYPNGLAFLHIGGSVKRPSFDERE